MTAERTDIETIPFSAGDTGIRSPLVRRRGLEIYDLILEDGTVKMLDMMLKAAVLGGGWTLTPANDSPEALEAVVHTKRVLKAAKIRTALRELMLATSYGFSVAEIVYGEGQDPYFEWPILKLAGKRPHELRFIGDKYGNIEGLTQLLGPSDPVPPEKFVSFTYDGRFGDPHGNSVLNAVHKYWLVKQTAFKNLSVYMDRISAPMPYGKTVTTDNSKMTQIRQELESARTGGALVYSEQDISEIGFLVPGTAGEASFDVTIRICNIEMSRAYLAGDRLFSAGETGAYAQAEVHKQLFDVGAQNIGEDLAEVVNESIVGRLFEFEDEWKRELQPEFTFLELNDEQSNAIANTYNSLIQTGALNPQDSDEDMLRDLLDLPPVDRSKEPTSSSFAPLAASSGTVTPAQKKAIEQREETQRQVTKAIKGIVESQRDEWLEGLSEGDINKEVLKGFTDDRAKEIKGKLVKEFKKLLNKGEETAEKLATVPASLGDIDAYIDFLAEDLAFTVNEQVLPTVRSVVNQAIRSGDFEMEDLISRISEAWSPFVDVEGDAPAGHRLENLIRGHSSDLYSQASLAEARGGGAFALEYNEVGDARSTPVSKMVDGKAVLLTNPRLSDLMLPLHQGERGTMVSRFEDDDIVLLTPAEEDEVLRLKKENLG